MKVFEDRKFKNSKGHESNGFYMDGYLKENLDKLKQIMSKNWDGVIMIDGIEGTAKSTLAGSIGYYLDPNYSINNIVFTPEQFFELVDSAQPGSVVHWDEFVFGGLSTEAFNATQNALIKKLTTIRKKNLYILLLMPQFYSMRAYFAVDRSRFLLHCKTPDGESRGFFEFYSFKQKQSLYYYCKKHHRYLPTLKNFDGRFTDTFGSFFNVEEYEKKKDAAIESLSKGKDEKNEKWKIELYKMMKAYNDAGYTMEDIGIILGKTKAAISQYMIKYNKILNSQESTEIKPLLLNDN